MMAFSGAMTKLILNVGVQEIQVIPWLMQECDSSMKPATQ
jgi:hypothetical protein